MPDPITFTLSATIPQTRHEVGAVILNLDLWPEFSGWGPLPGIKRATFETQTDSVVGTIIRCQNTDGSTHAEEIIAWTEDRIVLRLFDFSPPLNRLATHFIETWHFQPSSAPTRVRRTFELHPTTRWARAPLWLISKMLKQAIQKQFRLLNDPATTERLAS